MNRGEDWDRFWDAETVFKNGSQSNKRKRERERQIAGEGASFDEAGVNDEFWKWIFGLQIFIYQAFKQSEMELREECFHLSDHFPYKCFTRPIGCCCGRDQGAASEPK